MTVNTWINKTDKAIICDIRLYGYKTKTTNLSLTIFFIINAILYNTCTLLHRSRNVGSSNSDALQSHISTLITPYSQFLMTLFNLRPLFLAAINATTISWTCLYQLYDPFFAPTLPSKEHCNILGFRPQRTHVPVYGSFQPISLQLLSLLVHVSVRGTGQCYKLKTCRVAEQRCNFWVV